MAKQVAPAQPTSPRARRPLRTFARLARAGAVLPLPLVLLAGSACRRQAEPRAPSGRAPAVGRPAAAGLADIDACTLLTRDDAESLLGAPVKTVGRSHTREAQAVSSRCGYLTNGNPPKVVGLFARHSAQPTEALFSYEHAHTTARVTSGTAPIDLAGLGDKAFWAGGSQNQLHVLKESYWLIINDSPGPNLDQETPALAAAKKVLSHLP